MNNSITKKLWYIIISVIFISLAVATFESLNDGFRILRYSVFVSILVILLTTYPFLLLVVLLNPTNETVNTTKIHSAIFTSFLFILYFTDGSPGHSSPFSGIGDIISFFLYALLAIEFLVIAIAKSRGKRKGIYCSEIKYLFITTVIALSGGPSFGILIWSELLPNKVIAAAEQAADGKPYCFYARNKRDQTGLNMYSHDVNGFTWGFHKLMLVGEGNEKSYMNWSYRNKRFDPLSERTRESMHLDKIMKCNPVPHFALNLQ